MSGESFLQNSDIIETMNNKALAPNSVANLFTDRLLLSLPLNQILAFKNNIVGRYSCAPGYQRIFIVKPIAPIPLRETALGDYLKREYTHHDLRIHEHGAVSFILGGNDNLSIVLSSIAWSYAKLLRFTKKGNEVINENETKKTRQA